MEWIWQLFAEFFAVALWRTMEDFLCFSKMNEWGLKFRLRFDGFFAPFGQKLQLFPGRMNIYRASKNAFIALPRKRWRKGKEMQLLLPKMLPPPPPPQFFARFDPKKQNFSGISSSSSLRLLQRHTYTLLLRLAHWIFAKHNQYRLQRPSRSSVGSCCCFVFSFIFSSVSHQSIHLFSRSVLTCT